MRHSQVTVLNDRDTEALDRACFGLGKLDAAIDLFAQCGRLFIEARIPSEDRAELLVSWDRMHENLSAHLLDITGLVTGVTVQATRGHDPEEAAHVGAR